MRTKILRSEDKVLDQEELKVFQMKPEMGPPDIQTTPFPGDDVSWKAEFEAFLKEMKGEKTDMATPQDALRALEIVQGVYRQNQPVGAS